MIDSTQIDLLRRKSEIARAEARRLISIAQQQAKSHERFCCFYCGSTHTRLEGRYPHQLQWCEVWECLDCGLSQLAVPLSEVVQQTQEDANQLYTPPSGMNLQAEIDAHAFIMDLIGRYYQGDGRRLLELGCSNGYKLAAARQQGWQVTGVEFSARAVRFATEALSLEQVHLATIEEFLPDHPYDVLLAWHILEHVPSIASFLAHCEAYLRQGGFLFVQVPSHDHFRQQQPWETHPEHFNPLHRWYFTRQSLARCIEDSRLQVIDILEDRSNGFLTAIACKPSSL